MPPWARAGSQRTSIRRIADRTCSSTCSTNTRIGRHQTRRRGQLSFCRWTRCQTQVANTPNVFPMPVGIRMRRFEQSRERARSVCQSCGRSTLHSRARNSSKPLATDSATGYTPVSTNGLDLPRLARRALQRQGDDGFVGRVDHARSHSGLRKGRPPKWCNARCPTRTDLTSMASGLCSLRRLAAVRRSSEMAQLPLSTSMETDSPWWSVSTRA